MRNHYKGYRTSKNVIEYAGKHYYLYKLSLRNVSELLLERGIKINYETIHIWYILKCVHNFDLQKHFSFRK